MFQKKGELECVWCSMLMNFEGLLKIKGIVKIFFGSGVTCPSKGIFIDITSKHSGEIVPLIV